MRIGGEWNSENYSSEHKKHIFYLLNFLLDNDINFFDHADIYTNGKSEQIFGEFLHENKIPREKIIIQTKCGIRRKDDPQIGLVGRYDFSYNHIVNSVENSLKRLQVDYIDILLLHRPDVLYEPDEVAKAFTKLHTDGKVRYFGVSNFSPYNIQLLQKSLSFKLITNQIEINLLNYGVFDEEITFNTLNFKPFNSQNILNFCRINDISLQAWSPLGKGFIEKFEEKKDLKNYLEQLANQYLTSLDAIQIAFLLRYPAKIQPVLGSMNIERLKSMLKSVEINLSREEWYKILVLARGEALP